MIGHDRLFKELISTFFVEFLELFFPQVLAYTDTSFLEFLDKEIFTDVTKGKEYEIDLLIKTRFRNSNAFFLIHIENQSYKQRELGERMLKYFVHLYEKYALPIYPIVIFSYDNPLTPEPNTFNVDFPDKKILMLNYEVVQLNQLNWRDYLKHENPVASALMAKMKIAPKDRPKVKSECLRMLATLRLNKARMKMISGFVDTYLRLNAEEEEIFKAEVEKFEPVKKEVVMEIVTSWQLQGREEGREEGRQEGRQEGKLELIIRLLNRKIGLVEPELEERIHQLPNDQLENLAEALLDFTSRSDLLTWLNSFTA